MHKTYTASADIYATERCYEHCVFCSGRKGQEDVSLKNFKTYVNNWINYGTTHINITGGEPLLHPQLPELVNYAYSKGMDVALFTSGTFLNNENLKELAPSLKWLAVSIDGDQRGDSTVGRTKEHHNNAIKALSEARSNYSNLKIRVASVVTILNTESLFRLGDELIDNGIFPDLWRLKQVIPVRKAQVNWETLKIKDSLYNSFIRELINLHGKLITIKANPWSSKSGDLIVTYPSGESGVTIISEDGNNSKIIMLGNIFIDFNQVLHSWEITVGPERASTDQYMHEAWNN